MKRIIANGDVEHHEYLIQLPQNIDGLNEYIFRDEMNRAVKNYFKVNLNSICFVGYGVTDVIYHLLWGLSKTSNTVLLPVPYFIMELPKIIENVIDGIIIPYKVSLDAGVDIQLIDSLLEDCERGIVLLSNPSNPLGVSYEVEDIKNLCIKYPGCVFVVDESYAMYEKRITCIQLIKKYKNLVVLKGFSKGEGLPGLKLGVAFGAAEGCIKGINGKTHHTFSRFQLNILKSLECNRRTINRNLQFRKKQKCRMGARLREIGYHVIETATHFIIVDGGNTQGVRRLIDQLQKERIEVSHFNNLFNIGGTDIFGNLIRITPGSLNQNENIISAFARCIQYL